MTSTFSLWVKQHLLVIYFVVAYAISWSIMIPLALKQQGWAVISMPFYVHYFAAFGPMQSAIIVTWITDGNIGLKELFGRMFKWRVKLIWWLVAVSPLLLFAIGVIAVGLIQGKWSGFSELGQVSFLPDIGFSALFLWIFTYGFGEETGWRGFALPRLQKKHGALKATFILWIFWALWHAPAFFYVYDPSIIIGFLIGQFCGAIFFTWLYNSSIGSILMVIIFHGVFNFTTGCLECKTGIISMVLSTIVMIWAVWIVIKYKSATLSTAGKHVV